MALLKILKYPDPRLRIKAKRVTKIDSALRRVVADMYETMYDSQGVGLAATQVDVHWRLFTMDLSEAHDQPICIVNPEIVHLEGEQFESEGCLSVIDAWDKVKRAAKVILRGMDLESNPLEMEAEGLMAACFQHEIDHLDGILFVDHLSRLKRERIDKKIEKNNRQA
ncbi:MAG: peptide deformylase [Gammaproteobacteria bacterium RIFCSPHIGHO2_12_FULL_45_12]|nr:MAG: peptide deformylase [Gammaproteobacteria bacterium RIFCSPHIGHO2_12_FULL_45_12]